ncbi:uncharacterized protein BXIN_0936 [Babesia sp. Xinjiang]|uniref:uncharacterized protein n=1 Tax=Babesia sp. Xinjiang TaxID=462227 RepID=UPI000A21F5EF|nr:uncharacterized protein BXIN_0936 [Babesia sp. Xinjiang]ORM42058.1 hypothetical protein BXIN_0936 [Babesia sp. Xinjiang]
MKCGILYRISALAIWAALLSSGKAITVIRKHTLIGATQNHPCKELIARLKKTKGETCNFFSCIGARKREQRKALLEAFNIDHKQSSTLYGPLKPRCDIWELEQPKQSTLILDVDIPPTEDDMTSELNRKQIMRICHRSSVVLVHLNQQDIRYNGKSFQINREARHLLRDLAKGQKGRNTPDVYVFLPDINTIKQDATKEDRTAYEQFKTHLYELVHKNNKFHFKSYGDQNNVYKNIKNQDGATNTADIARTIDMDNDDKDETTNSSLVQIREASFGQHRMFLKDRMAEIYRGSKQPTFANAVQSSMVDAALAFYLRTRHINDDEMITHYLDQEYKHMAIFAADAYLRIIMQTAAEAKNRLRKELGDDPKQDTDILINTILADHDSQLADALESLSNKMKPPEWLKNTAEEVRNQLRDNLSAIVAMHKGIPKPTAYTKHERAVEKNYAKQKKKRGINVMLAISCMLRERGYGNRQGYINYQWGPLILTLGYANDRDIAENKPGTGLLTPAFRIQPKLHVNISL